jgi:hypothetical protein
MADGLNNNALGVGNIFFPTAKPPKSKPYKVKAKKGSKKVDKKGKPLGWGYNSRGALPPGAIIAPNYDLTAFGPNFARNPPKTEPVNKVGKSKEWLANDKKRAARAAAKKSGNRPGSAAMNGGPRSGGGGGGSYGSGSSGSHAHGSSSGAKPPKGPVIKPGPDEIDQMVRAALQQSRRLTDFYQTQTEAQRQAVVADAETLSKAAGSLSTTTPITYYQGADQPTASQANSYTDLVNAVGSGNAKATAGVNQAMIADSGNALQKLFGSYRNSAEGRHVEYGRDLQNKIPEMRRQREADQAEQMVKQAEAQYLRDKLGLESQKALDSSQLGWARLGETQRSNQARESLSAADKQARAALKGLGLDSATRKEVNAWVKANLYTKMTESSETVNPDGTTSKVSASSPTKINAPYQQIMGDMMAAGFSPQVALRIAQNHSPKSFKKTGSYRFYKYMIEAAGMTPRQALKQVSGIYGKKDAEIIRRNLR